MDGGTHSHPWCSVDSGIISTFGSSASSISSSLACRERSKFEFDHNETINSFTSYLLPNEIKSIIASSIPPPIVFIICTEVAGVTSGGVVAC